MDRVIHGTGGAGEVKDEIDFADVERFADVFFHEVEPRIIREVGRSGAAAGEQVVDDNYAPAFAEQGIAEMGSQETGAAGDQGALGAHALLLPFFIVTLAIPALGTVAFRAAGTPSG